MRAVLELSDLRDDRLPHQRFQGHAVAHPSATALRFRGLSMSYGTLNERANALAHDLLSRGLGAEARVMVCVEPSFEIAVAILGILKAGAVYVPLDPTYPRARVEALLEDVQPALVLAQPHLVESLQLGAGGRAVLTTDALASGRGDNPSPHIDEAQTAAIYFTSGTTGLPKGAMLSQANLRHYLRAAQERYGICAMDVMPAVARFSFSISMFELMAPLISGGAVILLEREHILDPARMAQTLSEATLFHIGPSLLKTLLAYIEAHVPSPSARFSQVRHASSGGDLVPPELLEQLKRVFPVAEVFVIYGCSEIGCMGCTWEASRGERIEQSYVGRPFEDVEVRLLDAAQAPVPSGELGEVWFAGGGVARGYLHRPELTAERFVQMDGRRWYRTGDLGRLSRDGLIQFAGRQDFQIQLRGMRVELGEIEHHLRRAPGVRESVVVAKELDAEKALVAYFAGDAEPSAVRDYLRGQLPEHMVPLVFVRLDRLPVNHNFKLDRRALPEPTAEDRRLTAGGPQREVQPPRTETERCLAEIWREVLGVDEVGLDDHFFDLGGDSLLALNLIGRIDGALSVMLGGLEIVREPLGALAAICDQRRGVLPGPGSRLQPRAAEPVELFHFGADQTLYGVLHAARGAKSSSAVLVCPPLGAEAVRAMFVLQRLAVQLAARGVPSLRFDYFGHGDSLGESATAPRARWESDVTTAYQELKRRTGAEHISIVGVRMGALLSSRVLHHLDVRRFVLWDPVCDGAAWLKEMTTAQEGYLHNARYRRRWQGARPLADRVELGGMTYSAQAVRDLGRLTLAPLPGPRPRDLRWLETTRAPEHERWYQMIRRGNASAHQELLERDCGWGDFDHIEHTLPDVGISAALLKLVVEP
jgi:amino acid adenylation domain-containing protein